jgi:oxygen-independent coproporphyrinogen-3 oxidase
VSTVEAGVLHINRALRPTAHQRLIREMILQMKEGHLSAVPFRTKFGVDILQEFSQPFAAQQAKGYLTINGDEITLTRKGILQADTLLPEYFEEQHREVRYT